MKNLILPLFSLASAILVGLPVRSEIVNGEITTASGLALKYTYESESNKFAINAEPLFAPKVVKLNYTAVPKETCKLLRDLIKAGPELVDAEGVAIYHPATPLDLKVHVANRENSPEFSKLVEADLKQKGIYANDPQNSTFLGRLSLQIGFSWSDQALSAISKTNLQAKAQKPILDTWLASASDAEIYGIIKPFNAPASMLCDLQEKNLNFIISYEYENHFTYSARNGIATGSIYSLWKSVGQKAKWIDELAAKSDNRNMHETRLIAASSLLTLEIINSDLQGKLLKPDLFLKTFSAVFNEPTVEVSRYFSERTASELADRLGEQREIKFNNIKGTIKL